MYGIYGLKPPTEFPHLQNMYKKGAYSCFLMVVAVYDIPLIEWEITIILA